MNHQDAGRDEAGGKSCQKALRFVKPWSMGATGDSSDLG
jgi:hypothetical protein